MKVYISIKEMNNAYGVKILDVSTSKERAVNSCLQEHAFSKCKWIPEDACANSWHNGYGLKVKVLEFEIKHED